MLSIDSFERRGSSRAAIKAVAVAGLLAAAAGAAAMAWWRGGSGRAAAYGLAAAWAVCSAGVAGLLAARRASPQALWRTFWAGMVGRLVVLAGLAAWGAVARPHQAPALLAGYALGVALLLPLEAKAVPLR